jgi:hypothetical protein
MADSGDQQHSDAEENIAEAMKREKAEFGWRKLRHVVCTIHTNYSAVILVTTERLRSFRMEPKSLSQIPTSIGTLVSY